MHMKKVVHDRSWRVITSSVLSAAALAWSASSASAQNIGTNTTVEPYLLPSNAKVQTVSIMTVKDLPAGNNYKMVGIPDGLGAFRNSDAAHQFTLLMNHELGSSVGTVREHGSQGSFVSQWLIDGNTLEVIQGQDLTDSPTKVFTWNGTSYVAGTTAWNRFCSADLPAVGALSFQKGNIIKGTSDRIFLNGEENDAGRAFAHIASGPHKGESWQLPRLGRVDFENVLASPYSQEKTIVVTMDDGSANTFLTAPPDPTKGDFPSELHVYVGNKSNSEHPVDKAGLTNGKLHGVKVFLNDPNTPLAGEDNTYGLGDAGSGFIGKAKFTLVEMGASGDVSAMDEVQLEQDDITKNIFRMQRIEDGAWDPRKSHANDFYFVTTASFTSNSRLWRLRFDDIEHPENGGTIEILLKGDEGQKMFDNITVDQRGRILLQEDVGNQARLGKVWLYGIDSGNLIEVAHHNEKFFVVGGANFLTQDEESSGIIDAANILGEGWFLLDVQAHTSAGDSELVELGQLLAMYVNPSLEASAAPNHEKE
jgi:hypothetical protein